MVFGKMKFAGLFLSASYGIDIGYLYCMRGGGGLVRRSLCVCVEMGVFSPPYLFNLHLVVLSCERLVVRNTTLSTR